MNTGCIKSSALILVDIYIVFDHPLGATLPYKLDMCNKYFETRVCNNGLNSFGFVFILPIDTIFLILQ